LKLPRETPLGWFEPTLAARVDEVAESVSLDAAMFLEFTYLSMKVLAAIGIPLILAGGSFNCIFSSNGAQTDRCNIFDLGLLPNGSVLHWVYTLIVWAVVLLVTGFAHLSMARFVPRRMEWLRRRPLLQARTIWVENIPPEFRSDKKLKECVEQILPNAGVTSSYICQSTTQLQAMVAARREAREKLDIVQRDWDRKPHAKLMVRESILGAKVEAIPYWTRQLEVLELQIDMERDKMQRAKGTVGGLNTSTGFVTLSDRRWAQVLLCLDRHLGGPELWRLDSAPDPNDVHWRDAALEGDSSRGVKKGRTILCVALVACLCWVYMPLLVGVTNLARLVDFWKFGLARLQPFWAGLAPSAGLQLMMCMLPTFLSLIFDYCLRLKSTAWTQHTMQVWYYWMQLLFVLVVTTLSQNVKQISATMVQQPSAIFSVVSETLPFAARFYINYLVLQWMSHSMGLTRYFSLFKFKAACSLFDEKEAKVRAEPEDQDFSGIGSRSARSTVSLTVAIIFGTLCPFINLVAFIDFAICRVVYGYLLCFAETKKTDLGGVYWVTMLEHLFVACMIYSVLMTMVLATQAASLGPAVVAAPSLVWVLMSKAKFTRYRWRVLPLLELTEREDTCMEDAGYLQPELQES